MLVRGKPPTIDNRALSWLEITLLTKSEETHEINTKHKINRNGVVKKACPTKTMLLLMMMPSPWSNLHPAEEKSAVQPGGEGLTQMWTQTKGHQKHNAPNDFKMCCPREEEGSGNRPELGRGGVAAKSWFNLSHLFMSKMDRCQ